MTLLCARYLLDAVALALCRMHTVLHQEGNKEINKARRRLQPSASPAQPSKRNTKSSLFHRGEPPGWNPEYKYGVGHGLISGNRGRQAVELRRNDQRRARCRPPFVYSRVVGPGQRPRCVRPSSRADSPSAWISCIRQFPSLSLSFSSFGQIEAPPLMSRTGRTGAHGAKSPAPERPRRRVKGPNLNGPQPALAPVPLAATGVRQQSEEAI
ncbi:hypothetical protein SKAU_G00162400 [Synaphobranchus kaupii]|uniref:Uncharacterized protein n=1 Tax=Synaphobranchus kaupii TaxID=118154 RepID=A0A9Q1IZW4_SYNKA|nr:hypothetical protein SKAU_G00162400 [Synaphobranchus kaupii]